MHGVEPTDGSGLRERRPKEPTEEQNNDMQSHSEERKSEKTRGRTPDGMGKSVVYCLTGVLSLSADER